MKSVGEVYRDAPTEIRLKAPLLNTVFLVLIGLAALIVLNLTFVTFTWVRMIGVFSLLAVTLFCFARFRGGEFEQSSTFLFTYLLAVMGALRLYDTYIGNGVVFAPNVAILGSLLVLSAVFVRLRVLYFQSAIVSLMLVIGAYFFVGHGHLEKTPDALSFELIYPGIALTAMILGAVLGRSVFNKVFAAAMESLDLVQKQNALVEQKNADSEQLIQESARQLAKADDVMGNAEDTAGAAGQIAGHLQSMQDRIVALDGKVHATNSSLQELEHVILQLQNTAESQASHTVESSTVIEEMVEAIQSVASIAGQKEALISDLDAKARTGRARVEETALAFRGVSDHLATIEKMTQVISAIARQTNLLAVNASIEAAHAGEAGKGFKVVASEIRNLASSSSQSAKEISTRLEELVSAITSSKESISKTGESFEAIQVEVSEVAMAMREIVASTKELSAGSDGMLSATRGLHEGIEVLRDVIARTSQMHEAIQGNEDEVAMNSRELTDGIKEINHGIRLISEAITKIHRLSAELKAQSQELFQSVKRDAETMQAAKGVGKIAA